jgi:hypothetical protein
VPYTHFRFIAYEVPTASLDEKEKVRSGFDPGQECNAVPRIPVGHMPEGPYLLTPDARIRLLRLAAVVDRAARHLAANPHIAAEQNTLKVFMAPEFYFRPSAGYSIDYEHDTYPHWDAYWIMEQLTGMFKDPDFHDWLIVPGTIMLNLKEAESDPRIYNNIVMAVKGGDPSTVGWVISCPKAVPSRIDGVPDPYVDEEATFLKDAYEDFNYRKLHIFGVSGKSGGLGVPCGIEVCLDHALDPSVLKKTLSEWDREGMGRDSLSLHLLTAGGMRLKPGSVAARERGYFLRNDGLTTAPHSEMHQVEKYLKKTSSSVAFPYELDGIVKFSTSQDGFPGENLDLHGAECVPMLGHGWIPKRIFTQRLVFYPRCKLP